VITKEWVEPVDKMHKLFRASSDVSDSDRHVLVTAYPLERPDGQWSLMLVNKDQNTEHSVKVRFTDTVSQQDRFFTGTVDQVVFGPDPNGPPAKSTLPAGGPDTLFRLPKSSIVVLRGKIAQY